MKRVVVTGATGFIGKYTLPFLIHAGFEVHALNCNSEGVQIDGVVWHKVDLMDYDVVDALLHELGATHLLHLAWYTKHGKFWHTSENLQWVACSLNLLKNFISHGGQRVLMAGSCAEYDWSKEHCTEQETECHPATLYGTSKHALRQISQAYCEQNNVSFSWGRIFFLYGPGEVSSRFVPALINGLLQQQKVPCSNGTQVRDFMYVEDVASAFVALLQSNLVGAINIASGKSYTLREIGEIIMNQIDRGGKLEFGALPTRQGEPVVLTANVKRLKNELNWQPDFSLETGLSKTIDWWKDNRKDSCVS